MSFVPFGIGNSPEQQNKYKFCSRGGGAGIYLCDDDWLLLLDRAAPACCLPPTGGLALYLVQERLLPAQEEAVGELNLVPSLTPQPPGLDTQHLVEPVHVELPDEGRHVGVFVVVGQQRLGELRLCLYKEGRALLRPADEVVCRSDTE